MLRIAICDDMPDFLTDTKNIIEQWNNRPDDMTISLFTDGDTLIESHAVTPFDIILLDIVMPLLSGIETAAEIRRTDRSVRIVFLSSSAEFALDSYSVKAANYLLKPIDSNQLWNCLNELYADILNYAKCITIKSTTTIHRVELRNIEYLEAQGKQVHFSLTNGTDIKALDPFYVYENKLLLEDGFFKCHRSYLVNMNKIETYTLKEIKMRSGSRLPISRSCQKDFEAAYFSLIFGKVGDN